MTAPIIGIDLGTTNSCAAYCRPDGEVELIPYRGGEFTVPSVFAVDKKGNELVGYEAKRQWQLNPANTIYGSKRLVGSGIDSELVGQMREHVAYSLDGTDEGEIAIQVGNQKLRLHEIAGKILGKIRDVATDYIGAPVERAVVTVPAYFNDRQRQAVHKAGEAIGLKIIRVINEPTAAAMAYGAKRSGTQTVAIYDLGGGTFDISVIEIRDRVFEVKATGGDVFLGGIDFDNALIEYVLAEFKSQHGVSLNDDPVAMQRLRDMAERTKVDLSDRSEVTIHIPFISMSGDGKPLDVNTTVTREEMDTLTEHLVSRTFTTVAQVLDDAGKTAEEIDEILLVGGQTRSPMIRDRIRDFFGRDPSKGVHPDEAVAIGAALYAWSLEEKSDLSLTLLDVLPMAIGIEGATGQQHVIFERNAAIPNRKQLTFTTHTDDQSDLVMRLCQGDAQVAKENELLGAFTFSGLRKGPAGSVNVEVIFDVSVEGMVSLDARDLDTGAMMQQTVHFGRR